METMQVLPPCWLIHVFWPGYKQKPSPVAQCTHILQPQNKQKEQMSTSAWMSCTSFTRNSESLFCSAFSRILCTSSAHVSFCTWFRLNAVKSMSPSGRYVFSGTEPKVTTCGTMQWNCLSLLSTNNTPLGSFQPLWASTYHHWLLLPLWSPLLEFPWLST